MTGHQALANAIVKQAAQDYLAALKTLRRHPSSKATMAEALEIERFFHSLWYGILTQVAPDYLIDRQRKEAAK